MGNLPYYPFFLLAWERAGREMENKMLLVSLAAGLTTRYRMNAGWRILLFIER